MQNAKIIAFCAKDGSHLTPVHDPGDKPWIIFSVCIPHKYGGIFTSKKHPAKQLITTEDMSKFKVVHRYRKDYFQISHNIKVPMYNIKILRNALGRLDIDEEAHRDIPEYGMTDSAGPR